MSLTFTITNRQADQLHSVLMQHIDYLVDFCGADDPTVDADGIALDDDYGTARHQARALRNIAAQLEDNRDRRRFRPVEVRTSYFGAEQAIHALDCCSGPEPDWFRRQCASIGLRILAGE